MTDNIIEYITKACSDCKNRDCLRTVLKDLIRKKGINQKMLANRIQYDEAFISRLCTKRVRKITQRDIKNISQGLPCHPIELAALTDAWLCEQFEEMGILKRNPGC